MKNRKVLNVRTHIGGLHGMTSYDLKKDKAEMEITPVGVLVAIPNRPDLLVPWSNIIEVQVGPAEEDEKRRPARQTQVAS